MANKAKPFDVLKYMFEDPEKYDKLSRKEKRDAFFIVNRVMAANFPVQADLLNRAGGNTAEKLDFWKHTVRKRTNRTPGWAFTKPKKAESDFKGDRVSDLNVSASTLEKYSEVFEVGQKDFEDLMRHAPKNFKSALEKLEKQMSTDGNSR